MLPFGLPFTATFVFASPKIPQVQDTSSTVPLESLVWLLAVSIVAGGVVAMSCNVEGGVAVVDIIGGGADGTVSVDKVDVANESCVALTLTSLSLFALSLSLR